MGRRADSRSYWSAGTVGKLRLGGKDVKDLRDVKDVKDEGEKGPQT